MSPPQAPQAGGETPASIVIVTGEVGHEWGSGGGLILRDPMEWWGWGLGAPMFTAHQAQMG